MESNIAFVLNYAPHYREFILKKIDQELNADLYFGNIPNSSIKKLDLKELSNFKKEFRTLSFGPFLWYVGVLKLLLMPYKNYVITGDLKILPNWFILIYCKLTGKKTYLWTHGWYGREKTYQKLIKKAFYKMASGVLLYGDYAKSLMIKEGFSEKKLIPIYNSLDYDLQLKVRHSLSVSSIYRNHFGNNHPVVIFIGRIQKAKKIDMLLEAVKKLRDEGVLVNVVLLGDVVQEFDIQSLIDKFELKNQVWLYGASYDEKINGELLYNAAMCVSPGNVGLTAIHSLMYGTPVITHNNYPNQMPEFETIQEGVNGSFFKENDIDDMADKIRYLLQHPLKKEDCWRIIDEKWNPEYQIKTIRNTLNDNSH
ncbi:glycosyltransferase [Amniculibacterium sp. G2-70]|uniref:glycosyltransferase n=1 Tax=Amniculibacterium sp. G2-70 TaxID=2767188 RepID=UPI00165430C9|nr:glycosyltransferase [Amniculibacterium sp. G2-70]